MKILIQLDDRERGILGQRELILGFELADVVLTIDVETFPSKERLGMFWYPISYTERKTLKLSGIVVGEIYQETWPAEVKKKEKLLGT